MLAPVTFTVSVPASTKNRRRLVRTRRGIRSLTSKEGEESLREVAAAARRALTNSIGMHSLLSHFGDHSVAMSIVHDVQAETCTVTVRDMGPRPKGKTGRKRDLQNLQEAICDGIQGIVIDNDNQIDLLTMERLI
jgi:Holliday junction resolvase RusA-like endonuclease